MTLDAARIWVRRVRAAQWAHFVPLPAAGVNFAQGVDHALRASLRGALAAAAVLAWGYLLNAVTDRAMDLDAAKNPLTLEAPSAHRGALTALALTALLAAAVSPWALLAAAVSLLSGGLYSAGPRWKSLPFVGTALNVTSFAPLLFVAARDLRAVLDALPLALTFSSLLVQNQLLHEAADLVEDQRGGVRSTFAALGSTRSALVALACAVTSLIGAASQPRGGAALTLATLAVALIAPAALWLRKSPPAARRAHRIAAGALGAALFAASKL